MQHNWRRDCDYMPCIECGDWGIEGGCKLCGREPLDNNIPYNDKQIVVNSAFDMMNYIPTKYRDKDCRFDMNVLYNMSNSEQFLKLRNTDEFLIYAHLMNNIIEDVKKGVLPCRSYLFYAPQGYGKKTFAYTLLKETIRIGLNTLPLFDTYQLSLLLTHNKSYFNLALQNQFLALYPMLKLDKLYSVDVLVVEVAINEESINAYSTIAYLTEARARLDKSTIFISRYSKFDLSVLDTRRILMNSFNSLAEPNSIMYVPYKPSK